jgi:hypothetical protein
MKKRSLILFFLLLAFSSCQKYYLVIYQEKVSRDSLASTYVGTPDPRQKNPPKGQELIIEWQIPKDLLLEKPEIHLQVVYRDYSEAQFTYPIEYKSGYRVYTLVGDEYLETKGLLSYKAEIKTLDGKVFRTWQHQLWVKVIRIEEDSDQEDTTEDQDSDSLPFIPEQDNEEKSATFFPPTS